MRKIFKITTNVIIVCLVLSMALHIILLAFTENNDYRQWVYAQIFLQAAGVTALIFVNKFKIIPLVVFSALSIAFIYINAVYVNYGNLTEHLVFYPLFWLIYGGLLFKVRGNFLSRSS